MTGAEPESAAHGIRVANARQIVEILRDARIALGLEQSDVAAKSAVAKLTLSHLERGRRSPSLSTLIAWAAALGAEIRLVQGNAVTEAFAARHETEALRERTRSRMASGEAARIRVAAKVTRTAMAEILGCSHTAIAKWEANEGRIQTGQILSYGRILDALDRGEALPGRRGYGHDSLGVRLDNLLRREGVDRERALAMADEELTRMPGLGVGQLRRIQECRAEDRAAAIAVNEEHLFAYGHRPSEGCCDVQ